MALACPMPGLVGTLEGTLHIQAKGHDHVLGGSLFSFNGHDIDMVCRNLHQAYLLEVGLTQLSENRETLLVICM